MNLEVKEARALLKFLSGEDITEDDAKNLPFKAVKAFREILHRRFGYAFILPDESLDDAMEFVVMTPGPEHGLTMIRDFNQD